jgi:hypothetical protein
LQERTLASAPGGQGLFVSTRRTLEIVDLFESGQEGLPHGVLSILLVPEDAPSDDQQPARVGANAHLKGVIVAGLHSRDHGCLVRDRARRVSWDHLFHIRGF